ncbi:MAG: esterase-like activity of phytase family protein, partial [Candidatus Promineifilaceae bacterium]
MSKLSRIHLVVLVVFGLSILALTIAVVSAAPDRDGQVTVADVEFIGELEFPTGYQFAGTEVGGLSSITYDAHRGVYYSISDDQGQIDPVRFYTLAIDVSDGSLDPGDITLQDVTFLRDQKGELLQPASL